jgi:branched-chain amino acid aminotransferase
MAHVHDTAYFNQEFIPFAQANLSVASSAVLYGLSVYSVFHAVQHEGAWHMFRLEAHYKRLRNSAKIINLEWPQDLDEQKFVEIMKGLLAHNDQASDVFVRVSIHADAVLPGTRSRGISTQLSAFVYDAEAIVPSKNVRLKTSQWRRVPDNAIPSRAKVNGAYVNSVLARQDALDAGYDDCVFLDQQGHVCELSAANIFLVRDGVLITPDTASDLLEGINRHAVMELAREQGITVQERTVDLTELYIADEVFASGTSAFIASVSEIDGRLLPNDHPITSKLAALHEQLLFADSNKY